LRRGSSRASRGLWEASGPRDGDGPKGPPLYRRKRPKPLLTRRRSISSRRCGGHSDPIPDRPSGHTGESPCVVCRTVHRPGSAPGDRPSETVHGAGSDCFSHQCRWPVFALLSCGRPSVVAPPVAVHPTGGCRPEPGGSATRTRARACGERCIRAPRCPDRSGESVPHAEEAAFGTAGADHAHASALERSFGRRPN
jgi:hypothetical protein